MKLLINLRDMFFAIKDKKDLLTTDEQITFGSIARLFNDQTRQGRSICLAPKAEKEFTRLYDKVTF